MNFNTEPLRLFEFVNKSKLHNLITSGLLNTEWTQEDRDKKHKSFNTKNYPGELQALEYYYNSLNSGGLIQIIYTNETGTGRYKLSNCLSSMRRIYRNYLLCDDYYDFDMVNSCSTILLHLASKHNSKNMKCLKSYVNNRQKWFNKIKKEFKCDDKTAKSIMTGLTFGANLTFKDDEITAYKNSLRFIQTELKETNLYNFIQTEKAGLSWLAKLIQDVEKNIVVGLLKHIINNYPQLVSFANLENVILAIYELDGFKLLKENVDNFGGPDAVIEIINEWLIQNSYNFISFINKSMDEKVDLDTNKISINQLKDTIQIQSPSPVEINTTFSPISPPTPPLIDDIKKNCLDDEITNKLKYINELELKEENTKEYKLTLKQAKIELKELNKRQKEIQKENERRQKEIQKENERRQKENERRQKEEEKMKKSYEKKMSQIQNEIHKQNELQQKREEKLKITKQKEEDRQKLLSEIIIALNDDEASDIIFDKLSSNFKSYKSRLFFKNENIWIADKEKIDDYVLIEILKSNIYAGINPITNLPISYAQNVSDAEKIKKALYAKIKERNNDDELYKKFHSTTKAKLCFKDGVLNFKNKTFTLWENIEPNEIYTTIIIDRNFNEYFNNPNQEDMNTIQTKILNVLYGDDINKALHFLSRAIAGHCEDKNWATYLGNRNCGKGVQYDLLKTGFDGYVSTFVLGNILCCRKSNGNDTAEISKKLYWLLDLEFTRLAISQEIPDPATGLLANDVLIKGVMSGGDTMVARRNFDRFDTHFNTDATLFILGNYSLNTTTEDCNETRIQFKSLVQFKTEEEIKLLENLTDENGEQIIDDNLMNRFHIKDKSIKDNCKNINWGNAMIMILMNNYKEEPVNIEIDISQVDTTYLLPAIRRLYDITNKDEDAIICKEVHTSLDTFDKMKIDLELKELGIVKKKSKLRNETRDKMCYFGIKLRE